MIDPDEDPRPTAWVGRAAPRPVDPWSGDGGAGLPPADPWPTAEQPIVPVGPHVIYVEAPKRRRGLTALLIIAGVFAACCVGAATFALLTNPTWRDALGQGSAPATSAPATSAPATTHVPTSPSPTPSPSPGLNSPVRDGKFEFVVTAVSCGHESVGWGLVNRSAKGQFCLVDLTVRNVGGSGQLLLDGVQKAYSADGAGYGTDSSAGVIANTGTSVWINVVNPGKTVTGKIVFDIPDGATIARLELHDSAFSEGTVVTLN